MTNQWLWTPMAVIATVILVHSEPVAELRPVDDALFAQIADLYQYDRSQPLEATVEGVWTARIPYVIEKVSYSSTHGERVPAYYAHPPGEHPGPAVVLVHGSNSFWGKNEPWCLDWMDILVRQGYRVLVADLPGYGERLGPNKETEMGPYAERELDIQSTTDILRGLDYLLSRQDVDSSRVGLLGGSLGAWCGIRAAGLDDRWAAVVLSVPGTWLDEDTHESFWRYAHPNNFAPRITAPVLTVHATGDGRTAGEALFQVLPEEKSQIWYESDHYLDPRQYSSDTVRWLNTRLLNSDEGEE